MEPLFLAVICGCHAGLFRAALHEVYIARIQQGDTCFAADVLGAREALLLVLVHFFEHGRWSSPMPSGVEGQTLTTEDQLFILMQAGRYLSATRGAGVQEAYICYERAESLCHSLNRPLLLYWALEGQWRYSLWTEKLTTTMEIANRVYSLAEEQNNSGLIIGAYRALAFTLYFLGDFESARQYATRGVQLWRAKAVEDVHAPTAACLSYVALCKWHFGEIASCQRTMAEAITLAKELKDTHPLALALWHAALLAHYERNPAEVERLASELVELSTRQNFALWVFGGAVLCGWARSASGDTDTVVSRIEEGITNWRATGSTLCVPLWLALKAEALHLADRTSEALEAITEAEALIERSEERWWVAELHRLRAVFLTTMGADQTQIEASFWEAIRIAKQQKSVSLAKRAEASYAEYRSTGSYL
jgi:tetratricopeptide (TPR) repeat protein